MNANTGNVGPWVFADGYNSLAVGTGDGAYADAVGFNDTALALAPGSPHRRRVYGHRFQQQHRYRPEQRRPGPRHRAVGYHSYQLAGVRRPTRT
jgi:hypothetical protein